MMDARDEPAGNDIGQGLDRCARALRIGDHLGRSGQARCRCRPARRAHDESTGWCLTGGAGHLVARGLLPERHGFASDHRVFCHGALSFEHDAVARLPSRRDEHAGGLQAVIVFERYVGFGAVVVQLTWRAPMGARSNNARMAVPVATARRAIRKPGRAEGSRSRWTAAGSK